MRQEVEHLRSLADEVARLLERGASLTSDELFEIGSVAGTLRARLQHYVPSRSA